MIELIRNDESVVFAGTVQSIKDGGTDERPNKSVVLKGSEDETVTVNFYGSRCEPVEKGLHEGDFTVILAKGKENEDKPATGIFFRRSGMFSFAQKNGNMGVVAIGTACRPRNPKEGMFVITVPIHFYHDGEDETKWHDVMFFDGEKDGRAWFNAAVAKRIIGEDKCSVAFTATNVTESEYNGHPTYSMVGHRLIRK